MSREECPCSCHGQGGMGAGCDIPGGCFSHHRPDGSACPGPCNARWRKADQEGKPHDLRPRPGDPVWCDIDAARIAQAVGAMPELYVYLHLSKAVKTADKHDRHGSGDAPSPSTEVDNQDETVRWLWDWEQTIRRERRFTEAEQFPINRERVLADAVRFIARNLEWALENLDRDLSYNLGDDILNEHRRLTRTTKTGDAMQHRSLACPRCARKTLVHELGTKHIACTNGECGRLLTLDEYDQLVEALAKSKGKVSA